LIRRVVALAILARFDVIALVLNANPAGWMSSVGTTPDDGIFSEGSSETVGMVDIGCPLTTPLIERTEGGRLDSEISGEHGGFVCLCLL